MATNRYIHLLCFILPLSTFLFLLTGVMFGTHSIASVLAWTLPFWLVLLVDWLNPAFIKKAAVSGSKKPKPSKKYFNGVLCALAILQLANVAAMLCYVSQLSWGSYHESLISLANLIAIRFLVGTSSGTSGIVLAHELIHRSQYGLQLVGRLLLCTVCYEHFVITHKRGHHLNLGMPDDIATARLGESFNDYWRRIYVGYFRYAWNSEQDRLKRDRSHPGIIHNQVFQGLLLELALVFGIGLYFGWLVMFMFFYQSLVAVRILEAVNYFQHWGLENGQFGNTYGWVSQSLITRYSLIGLSNHIGHHQDESKHFHEIAYSESGPKLPYGYFVMNLWVKLDNASYQQMARGELENFRLAQESGGDVQ